MKIAYLTTSIIPSRRANSIHVMQIASALSHMGHDVQMFVPDFKNTEKNVSDEFEYYGIPANFKIKKILYPNIKGRTLIYPFFLFYHLTKFRPNLVLGRSLYGCWVSTLLGFKTVFDSHGPVWEAGAFNVKIFRAMINRRSFERMTVNSRALKNMYITSRVFHETKFDPEQIVIAHNGSRQYPVEDKISLPGIEGRLKAGYFGHLYKGRGIELIYQLSCSLPDVEFYLVGGEDEDIKYWKTKSQNSNIHFLGHVEPGKIFMYRNSCDVLLAPYQNAVSTCGVTGDTSKFMNPIKILEYMSSGKPIIASNMEAIKEILNIRNSILVGSDDLEGWKKAIKLIMNNEEFSKAIAANAYKTYLESYTWNNRAKKLIEN